MYLEWTSKDDKGKTKKGMVQAVHHMLQLLLTLNYDNTSLTFHSDLITLDSSYMIYLLCSQSARL